MSKNCVYTLIPGRGLRFWLLNETVSRQKFINAFRAAWRRMPRYVRKRIFDYWNNNTPPIPQFFKSPNIQVSQRWASRHNGVHTRMAFGAVFNGGHEIRFWSDAIRLFPDELVQTLVAHELTHVFLMASGQNDENYQTNTELENLFGEEANVYINLENWGFDDAEIDVWVESDNSDDAKEFRRLLAEDLKGLNETGPAIRRGVGSSSLNGPI